MQSNSVVVRGLVWLLALVPSQGGAQELRLSPRDLFLEGERRSGVPLSVRYGLLRRQADGSFSGVDPSTTVFYAGDRVRIRIQANQSAFMAVLQQGSSGAWSVLYPRDGAPAAPLGSFETCDTPASPGAFVFDHRPGEERVVVIVAREQVAPQSVVDRLNAAQQRPKPSFKSRDLSYEKVEHDTRSSFDGTTIYVSNTATNGDPPLLIHLKLEHRAAP